MKRQRSDFGKQRVSHVGKRFGRLVLLKEEPAGLFPSGGANRRYLCRCDCGEEKVINLHNMQSRNTTSCGCYHRERQQSVSRTHGESQTRLHGIWGAMIQRCTNPNVRNYASYGGRGITVCDRWRKFENFREDMGERPDPSMSLDRIDNDKGYCPENCRWATASEQLANTRRSVFVTYRGKTKTMGEWSRETGMPYARLRARVKAGWDTEDIFNRGCHRRVPYVSSPGSP